MLVFRYIHQIEYIYLYFRYIPSSLASSSFLRLLSALVADQQAIGHVNIPPLFQLRVI